MPKRVIKGAQASMTMTLLIATSVYNSNVTGRDKRRQRRKMLLSVNNINLGINLKTALCMIPRIAHIHI